MAQMISPYRNCSSPACDQEPNSEVQTPQDFGTINGSKTNEVADRGEMDAFRTPRKRSVPPSVSKNENVSKAFHKQKQLTEQKQQGYMTATKAAPRQHFFNETLKGEPATDTKAKRQDLIQSSPPSSAVKDEKNPGLKRISKCVMDAVVTKRMTTYKEVAAIVSKQNESNPMFLMESSNSSVSAPNGQGPTPASQKR
jgi:hypothetical protein